MMPHAQSALILTIEIAAMRFGRVITPVRLSEKLLQTYWLVKYEGVSCAQTARLLGTSTDAVKQRVHRVKQMLHVILGDLDV